MHRDRHFRLVGTERGCHGDPRSGLHPWTHPRQYGRQLTLLFVYMLSTRASTISLEDFARATQDGWEESSRYRGKPHGSPLYIVKGPSTLRVPLILPHTMHMGLVMRIGVRMRTCASQFSILFVIDAGCMYDMHTRDIGLNSAIYSRMCAKQMQKA